MSKEPLQKHTLNLREGDYDYIANSFSSSSISAASVIRLVVSKFVDKLKTRQTEIEPTDLDEVTLDDN